MYQKMNLSYSHVEPLLLSTISTLESLKDKKNGVFLVKFLSSCPSEPVVDGDGLFTFQFEGHTIRDSAEQRRLSVSVCDQFVDSMISSLNSRFCDNEDGAVMKSLSSIFDPSLKPDDVQQDCDVVSDYLCAVGFAGSRIELSSFVAVSRASIDCGNHSVFDSNSCANLAIQQKDVYPAAADAAARFLILPVADCERGFSKQNLIKTSLRKSLKTSIKSLDNLMKLSIDGPPGFSFPYKSAFKSAKKSRRIMLLAGFIRKGRQGQGESRPLDIKKYLVYVRL